MWATEKILIFCIVTGFVQGTPWKHCWCCQGSKKKQLKLKQITYKKKSEVGECITKYMARVTWLSKMKKDSQLQILTNLVKTNSNHPCFQWTHCKPWIKLLILPASVLGLKFCIKPGIFWHFLYTKSVTCSPWSTCCKLTPLPGFLQSRASREAKSLSEGVQWEDGSLPAQLMVAADATRKSCECWAIFQFSVHRIFFTVKRFTLDGGSQAENRKMFQPFVGKWCKKNVSHFKTP